MAKTLCDWSKRDLRKHADELLALVDKPNFFCRKCARVANTPKVLCKPCRLPRNRRDVSPGCTKGKQAIE